MLLFVRLFPALCIVLALVLISYLPFLHQLHILHIALVVLHFISLVA